MYTKPDKRNDRYFEKDGKLSKMQTDLFTYVLGEKKGLVFISKPNMIAIYLNIADKAIMNAKEIYETKLIPNLVFNDKRNEFEISMDKVDTVVFDFIEKIIEALVFYYTSVEAFTNSLIPADFKFKAIVNGEVKDVECEWVQKNLKLEEKIKKIIPEIWAFSLDANNLPYWKDFTDIEKFRNELIHLKKEKINNDKSEQLMFLMELIGRAIDKNLLDAPRKLISFISSKVGNHPSLPYEFCNQSFDYKELHM